MSFLKKLSAIFALTLLSAISISAALAQSSGTGSNPPSTTITIENPLGAGATIETLLEKIINFLAFQIGPIVAVAMILYAAFLMITAGGDENKFKLGRKTLLYTLIGYGILLLSNGLILVIKDLLGVAQ